MRLARRRVLPPGELRCAAVECYRRQTTTTDDDEQNNTGPPTLEVNGPVIIQLRLLDRTTCTA